MTTRGSDTTAPAGDRGNAEGEGSVLAREIAAQPGAVEAFLARNEGPARRVVEALPPFSYVLVAARGSSDHAALYAKYAWAELAGHVVALAAPSLHTLYRRPPRLEGALVVGISQSGQSPDIVAVAEEARRQGRPTLAITNDPGSPLARACDHVLVLGVAEESIAATGTYTCQLAAVALLGALWSRDAGLMAELAATPEAMRRTLTAASEPVSAVADRLRDAETLLPIARGTNLATAHELALKVREVVGIGTQAYSAADFRHGSIATVKPGTPVALIAPGGPAFADVRALADEVEARGATVLMITQDAKAAPEGALVLPVTGALPEWLTPLGTILPGQLLTVALAERRGIDPDHPRGLEGKIVRTR